MVFPRFPSEGGVKVGRGLRSAVALGSAVGTADELAEVKAVAGGKLALTDETLALGGLFAAVWAVPWACSAVQFARNRRRNAGRTWVMALDKLLATQNPR